MSNFEIERSKANELIDKVIAEVKTVIIGKDEIIRRVLMAILAQGNILLDDVPGVGKTTMALSFARTFGLTTKRVQFTPDTMPSDIVGFSVYDKESGNLVYKEGAIMTNLLLADEINRTSSKTQSALLEAMEEKRVTVDGKTYALPDPFIVLATQNPVGSAGTTMLPESQLDRFMIRLSMGYPDISSQINILKERHSANPLDQVNAVASIEDLQAMIAWTTKVHMEDGIYEYVAKLIERTRNHEMITLGISPRGALALCRMAKARAFVLGREYVVPEDIQEVFPYVCGHRLVLNSRARLNEMRAEEILASILKEVEMPVIDRLR